MNATPHSAPKLGRGLSAILGEDSSPAEKTSSPTVRQIAPSFLQPGKYQPRDIFVEAGLHELESSIRSNGILQPLIVRKIPKGVGKYEIVAGERRWRAAQNAGLDTVPVIIRELTDEQSLEIALIENIQRENLTPLEEAQGIEHLIMQFEYTQDKVAKILGKSRSHITNLLRLLQLPEALKKHVNSGLLSAGHARALLKAENADELARQVIEKKLNVRETEKLARQASAAKTPKQKPTSSQDAEELEKALNLSLGTKVDLKLNGAAGTIMIHFDSLEKLDELMYRLANRNKIWAL